MNWYLVRDGKIVTRYGDVCPSQYLDPDSGKVFELAGKSAAELASMGWLAGTPTTELAFDSASQKSYIQPQVPEDLQKYIDGWKTAIAAGSPLPVPTITEQWVVEALTPEELQTILDVQLRDLRAARDRELMRTDVFMLADSPIVADPAQFAVWKTYRQQLRDLPDQVKDPAQVTWPVAPDAKVPAPAPTPASIAAAT